MQPNHAPPTGPNFARLKHHLKRRFSDDLSFFKTWVDKPKALGAVLPTSGVTARKMASLINTDSGRPVLELGPGTGVITKAILERGVPAGDIYSVEFVEEFLPGLRNRYPGVNFIQGDAFDLDTALIGTELEGVDRPFDAVISAVPLLNFPVDARRRLLNDLFDRMPEGRPVVQISYGPVSPIPPDWTTYSVEPLDWMMRNLPPARLWTYRRIAAS